MRQFTVFYLGVKPKCRPYEEASPRPWKSFMKFWNKYWFINFKIFDHRTPGSGLAQSQSKNLTDGFLCIALHSVQDIT